MGDKHDVLIPSTRTRWTATAPDARRLRASSTTPTNSSRASHRRSRALPHADRNNSAAPTSSPPTPPPSAPPFRCLASNPNRSKRSSPASSEKVGCGRRGRTLHRSGRYEYAAKEFSSRSRPSAQARAPQAIITGNAATAMGGRGAGVKFYAASP